MEEDLFGWNTGTGVAGGVRGAAHAATSWRHFFGRVRFFEQLFWDLAKIVDETDGGISLQRVFNATQNK